MSGKSIVIMGVSGCGKSTIGELLATRMAAKFIDGDDLHPKANIVKMSHGKPLDDQDRAPWLERVRDAAFSIENKNETGVIVCSSLKRSYRDKIREGNNNVCFIFLDGHIDLISQRVASRSGHFMKMDMVKSQFDILERPLAEENIITINIDTTMNDIIEEIIVKLAQHTHLNNAGDTNKNKVVA
ncbi:gluconokinase [Aliivibrio fischeri]|uniref:gluconokinase n=1 Tax=Aliivibrio fischeri TaxID=668 RepID=UPI0012D92EC8|nr:gluconokinase [Aliivibrio fischeri]MUI54708.1 AAA family ATPase [Aliivibrio fischeri]